MPKELLSAAQAWEVATFFSIDTNIIQAAGYNFKQGELHQLPKQLPVSMGLQLPEIVVSEIVKHRMDSVLKAHSHLKHAADDLQRLTTIDASLVHGSIDQLNAIEMANQLFTNEVHDYAAQCRGGVLRTAGADAVTSLFADYFAQRPPFGLSQKKKSEFPDAMCLWLLERYAKDNDTIGIIASDDKGWQQYAETSERLYCVGSIDELATLFATTNEHAEAVKGKITAAVADTNSPLGSALVQELNRHVANSQWDGSEIYTGSSCRVEPEFCDAHVAEQRINGEINVWSVKGEPTTWVVELTVSLTVNVYMSVEFFGWDSIDREELSFGTQSFTTQEDIDVDVYLTCSDVRQETLPSDWHTEIEIADGDYSVAGFEVELDYGGPDD